MEKHVRELRDYLADYGASNIHMEPGGKHNKIQFEYGGLQRSYIVARSASTDHHAVENIKADLKRMLRPPVPIAEKQPRKLEEMMAELNQTTASVKYTPPVTKPSKVWQPVRLSAYHYMDKQYKHSNVLYFVFPREILAAHPEGMKIESLDSEHWKITRGGHSHFREYGGSSTRITFADPNTAAPFGSTEAEAIEADGAILVYLPLEGRAPIASPKTSKPWPTQAALTPLAAENLRPIAATALTIPVPANLEQEMRDIKRRILAVEATCPYRLVRLEGGRIQWRAPIIE